MSFIDNKQNKTAFASQIGERGVKLRKQLRKVEKRFGLESEKNLGIKGSDGETRVGKINDGVNVGIERVSKGAEGSRFACADVAGDKSGESLLEGKGETGLDLAIASGGEQVVAGDGLCERGETKTVEIIQGGHCFPPFDHFLLQNHQWATEVG